MIKVRGHYHTRAQATFDGPVWHNPGCGSPDAAGRNVAIIGCGYYAYSNIAYYLRDADRAFLRYAVDVNRARARSLCADYGGAYATDDIQQVLDDERVKLVFIASNHASHATYAIQCIRAGKHAHIEKPHVVSAEQLAALSSAMAEKPEIKVFLGFNRPRSDLFAKLRHALDTQAGPQMINWFVAGHHLPDNHWYYDQQEGGRVLGNLSHWTDLTLHLIGKDKFFPCEIAPATPAGSKSDYVVAVNFPDGSTAVIAFSAKGEVFEGVSEILHVQKGDCLAHLHNFEHLTLELGPASKVYKPFFRDHGHSNNIRHSYTSVLSGTAGEDADYIKSTARFFLAIRDALESGRKITLAAQ